MLSTFLNSYGYTISTTLISLGLMLNENEMLYNRVSLIGLTFMILAVMIFWVIVETNHRFHLIAASVLFCLAYLYTVYTHLKNKSHNLYSGIAFCLATLYMGWTVSNKNVERTVCLWLGLFFLLTSQFWYIPEQRRKGKHFSMALSFFISGWSLFLFYASAGEL